MKLLLLWLAALVAGLSLLATPVRAGYSDGLAAMERGDYAAAFQEFEALAADGHREAQFTLAFLYDFGQGTEPDPAQALKWYRAAADQGLEEAQLALALMYADGRGVTQDHAESAAWYRRAARQGNALAQNDLADLYRQGKGVPRDLIEAFVWYDAAAQGLPSGETRDAVIGSRDAVAAELSAAELETATARAADFRPETELPPAQPIAPRRAEASEPAAPEVVESEPAAPEVAEPEPAAPEVAEAEPTIAPPEPEPEARAQTADPPAALPEEPALAEAEAAPIAPPAESAAPAPDPEQTAALPPPEAVVPTPAPARDPAPGAEPVAPRFDSAEPTQVARVQALLSQLGYDPGPADGVPGGRTRAAIEAFEADHGWPPSGQITDRLEETLARVEAGRKRARFGQAEVRATDQAGTAAGPTDPGPGVVNPGFSDTLRRLLGDGSGEAEAQTVPAGPAAEVAALPDAAGTETPPEDPASSEERSSLITLIDERMASLEAIIRQVDTVSAAGLGWNLLQEWERASTDRFRRGLSNAAAQELSAEFQSTRQSQIVLGDPYGNFLRVTDAYRVHLETLKARFQ